ncbi:MAG: bifunctional 5,10-methylene-tetrahydrofolate dehydrogenase/5,10-methylene-tetrahydrofolate cyclohydrolase [Dehalococcoidales bacterium]|nr:bifunctional 5,10-methylene-tetrahydrofolate dehydrogenase/5,10-methylene-tetrahydrofolate cyclohydrolase [Dehalococcoidales bacterium]
MPAIILDGKKFSAEIREELKLEAQKLKEKGIVPGLSGILVGEDPGSATYVGLKSKACAEIGITEMMCHLPETVTEAELMSNIDRLNKDPKVHGIFIQLPLPSHLANAEGKALAAILPEKDVDGFHATNVGRAWLGQEAFFPAVVVAMQEMLIRGGFNPEYKNVVVVNVDNMVGKPFASAMVQDKPNSRANVTLCYPDTPDLAAYTSRADILVVSVNKPKFITADMVKEGAVVLDFGGNWIEDPVTKKKRTVGDVDFDAVKEKAGAISPVPGGIGPMLVTMLMWNTIQAAKLTV